ncbi:hypothetical protein FHX64_001632 [Microbacter margulisiae]|uniref:Uncharacterized protein n=1 Tax=Microbacter margulisiae TaxID=1350067 RepID=A0A7W5DQZ3_9PORP|nr:hypothetical protein [Microbacter margulisiae]
MIWPVQQKAVALVSPPFLMSDEKSPLNINGINNISLQFFEKHFRLFASRE